MCSLLYMFQPTQCSSSGESIVSIHNLVYITMCRCPSGIQVMCRSEILFVLITNLTHFFNVFISLLYTFQATQCSSSGESIISIHNLVYITVCKWPSGIQVIFIHSFSILSDDRSNASSKTIPPRSAM